MISEPEIRTARKRHSCNWCAERIEKGEKYENTFQCWGGDAWRSKMHLECGIASREYDYQGDTIDLVGQFQRGHKHEVNWYSQDDGVKDGCPGCIKERGLRGTGVCASCAMAVINGVRCHEAGCPEAWRDEIRECQECGTPFSPKEYHDAFCDASCSNAWHGYYDHPDDAEGQ